MQELESQWNLPIPWSNSIGVDPKVIFGLPPSAPPFDEDDIENHPPAPKRRKTKASENDDIDVAFPPADYYVAPPAPPVASTSTSPQPATQKSRGKRPRAASDSEDSLYTAASESDDGAIPGLRHVRCRWGGCNQLIERVDWQEHMDSAHRLRSVQCAARGRWYCQFTGCASDTASHASMVRHLRTKHFVKRVHVCDTCGDVFSRSDSRNRHVENKSCVEGRAKRR
ncbi:hypothetical protein TRAPUB_12637 [Trametes pubescens]|uniref:C2H2-type domain-containing protein n=1 Tax=Trametes pubescens TaxID=154538 RepID=A0A1M2VTC0_TRAPU|nr:hypothetical protein TRAPUB_12637 [Trametes pubescens]